MRFLSLLALSGCALVDAAGESKLVGLELSFTPGHVDIVPAPLRVEVADLDGQQALDLVVLAGNNDLVMGISLDPASGTYSLTPVSTVLTGPYTAIATGNLDDVDPDDMIATGVDKLNVFGSQGKGLGSHLLAGATPKQVTTGVLPSFGDPGRGIVITYVDSTTVSIVINPFEAEAQIQDRAITTSEPPVAVVVADTLPNGPGQQEVLIVQSSSVIEAQADSGQFSTFDRAFGGIQITHVATGDFGSDPAEDLAYAYQDGIAIASGSPSGLVAGVSPPVIARGLEVRQLSSGDFNGDRRADLAVLSAGALHVFLRAEGETFSEHVIPIAGSPNAMSVGDLDDDGIDDFLLIPGQEGGIDLLLSR